MAAFEHIMAMFSFIYALAIAHILSETAGLIRGGGRVRFSGLYAAWLLNAGLMCVANWISFWDLRALKAWPVGTIMFFLGMAIVNYLQAALTAFDVPEHGPIDLVAFHRSQGRRYQATFLAGAIWAAVANFVYGDGLQVSEWAAQNRAVIPIVAAAAIATVLQGVRAQWLCVAAILICWAIYFSALQGALG